MAIPKERIYQMALEKWGDRAQLEMAQEEATELALAVRKLIRYPTPKSLISLAGEIADVEIMVEQMAVIYKDYLFRDRINSVKEVKIQRLHEMLNKEG